jgi:hypothetical protein
MTMDRMTLGLTALVGVLVVGVLPVIAVVTLGADAPPVARIATAVTLLIVPVAISVPVILAPRAVRIDERGLEVERLGWAPVEIPWPDVVRAEIGPPIEVLGRFHRLFGNGGLMGYTGLYQLDGVGRVRLWATRFGRPTVVVHRSAGLPVVLGVDDPEALLAALRPRGAKA